jgi:RNA polymerase sigma factor (sigma-70 family)
MNKSTQESIIKAIISGKGEEVLSVLYKETLSKVKRMILKNSGNEEEANDIFQDAVLIFYKQVKNGNFNASFEIDGYIYTIAKHLWMKRIQKMNKNVQLNIEIQEHPLVNSPIEEVITNEKATILESVMDKIGEECKTLLKFSSYEKLSMKEICEKMGYSSENVAKTYNYRCKKKLADLIKSNPHLMDLYKL